MHRRLMRFDSAFTGTAFQEGIKGRLTHTQPGGNQLFALDIELATRAWERLGTDQQAPLLREAEERGGPLGLIIAEAITESVELLRNPMYRRAYEEKLDRQEAPDGTDPLLRKGA